MSTDGVNSEQLVHGLLKVYTTTKSLLNDLETRITTLEISRHNTAGTSDVTSDNNYDPDDVDRLCDKITSSVKSISANFRKYCDLNLPERRTNVTRRSTREDSGIGSGMFNSMCFDPNNAGVTGVPISEVDNSAEAMDLPETESQRAAMEHSDDEKSSIC